MKTFASALTFRLGLHGITLRPIVKIYSFALQQSNMSRFNDNKEEIG